MRSHQIDVGAKFALTRNMISLPPDAAPLIGESKSFMTSVRAVANSSVLVRGLSILCCWHWRPNSALLVLGKQNFCRLMSGADNSAPRSPSMSISTMGHNTMLRYSYVDGFTVQFD